MKIKITVVFIELKTFKEPKLEKCIHSFEKHFLNASHYENMVKCYPFEV